MYFKKNTLLKGTPGGSKTTNILDPLQIYAH